MPAKRTDERREKKGRRIVAKRLEKENVIAVKRSEKEKKRRVELQPKAATNANAKPPTATGGHEGKHQETTHGIDAKRTGLATCCGSAPGRSVSASTGTTASTWLPMTAAAAAAAARPRQRVLCVVSAAGLAHEVRLRVGIRGPASCEKCLLIMKTKGKIDGCESTCAAVASEKLNAHAPCRHELLYGLRNSWKCAAGPTTTIEIFCRNLKFNSLNVN